MLVEQLMEQLAGPVGELKETVDGVVFGNKNATVKGIVTTFICSVDIIHRAIQLGANVIISHESLYFQHHDHHEQFGESDVIQQKLKLLEDHQIQVIRFHDYPHRYSPDLITYGLANQLGWKCDVNDIVTLDKCTVFELITIIKRKLSIETVQLSGKLDQVVSKAFLSVGFRGNGANCIPAIEQHQVDVVITGEGFEWEMPQYIRDANTLGKEVSYIVLGHQNSEEWGMKLLASQLQEQYPALPITHIEQSVSIQYV